MKLLSDVIEWLEHRTGLAGCCRSVLFEAIPGGPKWRHCWGAVLLFSFALQAVTGLFLLMFYSGSAQTAWESVYYLQTQVPGGALLRALHHYNAQLLPVLVVLHLAQMVIFRAYVAPRELNFWLLLLLFPLTVGLSITGWMLPYDQQGLWAARVPLNLVALTPVAGPSLRELAIGGPEFGHHTLTRFLALHALLLPAMAFGILVWKARLEVRHRGLAQKPENPPASAAYWPDQFLRDAVCCLAVMAALLFLGFRALEGADGRPPGVEIFAPADPAQPFPAARPEWNFLFLFQFLKYFPSGTEIWGAIILPTIILGLVFLMPWTGRTKTGHRFNAGLIGVLLSGAVILTWLAIAEDRGKPSHQAALEQARQEADRALALARLPSGIPPAGAAALLRDDPLTQGPQLFARHCASCHSYAGHNGLGEALKESATASDLEGFGSRGWLTGLLDPKRIATVEYFGGTAHAKGRMVKFVTKTMPDLEAEERRNLEKVIKAVSAEAQLKSQRAMDAADSAEIVEGRNLIATGEVRCLDCHQFRKPDDTASAPDLTGYGSRAWLIAFLSNPAHERFYGKRNDRMPAFGEEGILTTQSLGLLADWLRGDWPGSGE